MPNIPTFENPADSLQPSDIGASAAETAARRIASLGHQGAYEVGSGVTAVGQGAARIWQSADDATAFHEKIDAATEGAKLQANLDQDRNKTLALTEPGDVPGALATWEKNTLEPARDAFLNKYTTKAGQQFAAENWAHYEEHTQRVATSEMASAAGNSLSSAVHTVANTRANAAMADPSSGDTQLQQWQHSLDGIISSVPGVDPKTASAARTRILDQGNTAIAYGTISGTIDKNPQAGRDLLASGKYSQYLTVQHVHALQERADMVDRRMAHEATATDARARQDQKDQGNALANSIVLSTIGPNGDVKIDPATYYKSIQDAAPYLAAEPGRTEALVNLGRSITDNMAKGKKDLTDPNVYRDFQGRIFLPEGDPQRLGETDIFKAKAAHQLSDPDFRFFVQAAGAAEKNPQLAADEKAAHRFSTDTEHYFTNTSIANPVGTPQGYQRANEFSRDFGEDFRRRRAAGESVTSIENDWTSRVPQYQHGLNAVPITVLDPITHLAMPAQPLPPIIPRSAGETSAAYAARVAAQLMQKAMPPPK